MIANKNNHTRISALPPVLKGKQLRENMYTFDVSTELTTELDALEVLLKISPGQKIAVAVANQGMNNLVEIVKVLIARLRAVGAVPFIVPVIGGEGLTAEDQRHILESIGVTELAVGAPIYSTMETVLIGESAKGIPVFIDRYAYEADGIIVVNRTKYHGGFRSDYKNGLMRMITIGLGKQSSVYMCRSYGSTHIAENIAEVARFILQTTKFLLGVAVIENQYQETTHIKLVTRSELYSKENKLEYKLKTS